jgi:hypothetical protein
MDIEIGTQIPPTFSRNGLNSFELFSFLEFALGFRRFCLLSQRNKPDDLPNVCPHTWSSFVSGKDGCGYYAVLGGLMERTHTYRNILRDRCFCINFLSSTYYDAMMRAISQNEVTRDEFAVCGFTKAECKTIHARAHLRKLFIA